MKTVTICGSMRFADEMIKIATKLETERGFCVLQPVYGFDGKVLSGGELARIKAAHYKKIDLSDAVYIVNIGGYIGQSVTEEIAYAKERGKEILFHEPI